MEESATDFVTDSVSGISGGDTDNSVETFLLGPRCLSQRLYQRSPPEDLALATMLVRPAQWFLGDAAMKDELVLTEERYGAVRRVCVVTEEDETWAAESQRRLASRWSPGAEVVAIDGADHMAMCSKPRELSELLLEIANKEQRVPDTNDFTPAASSSSPCNMESAGEKQQHRFFLVHGVCHGAWCWYKVATALQSAGHRVTALDMAACGANPLRVQEVRSFKEYSRPLLDAVAALPTGEKAVLVGHSFGGQGLALAMQACPDKIALAVFVSAAMPAAGKPMSFVLEQFSQETGPDFFMDCVSETGDDPHRPDKTFLLGPEYMARRLYQLSPPRDLALAMAMVRPSWSFLDDAVMNGEEVLTAGRYGAVSRVYVVAEDDASWSPEFQRRMASWNPGTEVRGIEGADHMPMCSKPGELSDLLVELADKYI